MASHRAARTVEKRPRKHANSSSTSPPPPPRSSSAENAPGEEGGNVDRVLFKNLVDMVPLVESLMDRRPNPSFRRRASLVYTPTPSHSRKVVDHNGKITAPIRSTMKRSDHGDNVPNKESDKQDGAAGFSIFSSSTLTAEDIQKNEEELKMLWEQLEDLQKKLLEKNEALKSLKDSLNEMNEVNAMLNDLKQQVVEKDSLITNTNLQLSNTKIKLEERQAALEKLELEATESNSKIEELQGILDSTNFEITAFVKLFDELSKIYPDASPDDNSTFQPVDQPPYTDDIDENDIQKIEDARIAYVAAVAAAKENPSEESLAVAAAEARFQLQAYLLNGH